MSNTIRLRTLLRFTIALSYWLQARHLVQAANFTVFDTNSSIVYQPREWWYASTDLCSTCLNPGLSTSFHEGIHPPITQGPDSDDNSTSTQSLPASTTAPPTVQSQPSAIFTADSSSAPTASSSVDSKHGTDTRRSFNQALVQRLDPDDLPLALVNQSVTMSFNFTGSAVYLFATQPPNVLNLNETSSNMDITVFLDNTPSPTLPVASSVATAYLSGQLVFSKSGLTEGLHQLVVQLGQNSTFIFEHLIYSTEATALPQSSPSPTVDPKVKQHNIATFAGAVGGSVGVLALFSLGLALSIMRRRYLAAKRESHDHESLHTNASDDSPHMSGPAPFVPRYFPDTVIPSDPPTYMAALATNQNNSTLLATLPPDAFGSTRRSYADIPPSTPPPPLEDNPLLPPPPPFLLDPLPTLPEDSDDVEEGALPPSMTGAEPLSHNSVSVGAEPSNQPAAPERVPLLQTVHPARPRSRASARSVAADTSDAEPTEGTHLREDVS